MAEPSYIVYAIPLRESVVVRIHNLPDDLTKPAAERVAAVVLALGANPMTWPALDGEPEYASWTALAVAVDRHDPTSPRTTDGGAA